jgi:hypothetical protein
VDDICKLKQANGIEGEHCEGEPCLFWRAVENLGVPTGSGCAVQYFEMLGEDGMAAWLLSVKERVQHSEPEPDK